MIELNNYKFRVLGNKAVQSIFGDPLYFISTDTQALELGTKFFTNVAGLIVGIRYIKHSADTSTHVGRIWTDSGTLLTSVTFTGETSSGWQQQYLTTPLSIAASTLYRVSVNAINGYPFNIQDFSSVYNKGNISTPISAGVFGSGSGTFPNSSFNNTNYFRDILFIPS